MLKIIIEEEELYDAENNRFYYSEALELELEHSLLSLSKWESKYEKPFLSSTELSNEEVFDYVMFMLVTPNITPEDVELHKSKIYAEVNAYINSPQSATTFAGMPEKSSPNEKITAELIYYWMLTFNIPFGDCETWHLNRLFSLIRIANQKNSKPKRMSRSELAQRNKEINERRKKELGTTG
jgi:hypothetical protein